MRRKNIRCRRCQSVSGSRLWLVRQEPSEHLVHCFRRFSVLPIHGRNLRHAYQHCLFRNRARADILGNRTQHRAADSRSVCPSGAVTATVIGFVLPPAAAQLFKAHMGFSLYNMGFTAGIVGILVVALYKSFGFVPDPVMIWTSGYNRLLGSVFARAVPVDGGDRIHPRSKRRCAHAADHAHVRASALRFCVDWSASVRSWST